MAHDRRSGDIAQELLKQELEHQAETIKTMQKTIEDLSARLPKVESFATSVSLAGKVGIGILALMGAGLSWIIAHIDALAKVFGSGR